MRVVFIIIMCLFITQASIAQRPMETIIDDAYDYIGGHHYGKDDIKWARLNFRLAKWFSFNKTIINDARQGLAVCKFAAKDTTAGIRRLKRIIGHADYTKVEKQKFVEIKTGSKERWAKYYATRALIDIYLHQKNYVQATKYLVYFENHINVTWYCGTGVIGHQNYIKATKDKIAGALP